MDPFTALAALRAAYSGIQYCCECLGEGTVQVQKIKKAAEQAQQIVKDAKGIWSIIKGLFGIKPAPAPAAPVAAAAAPAAKSRKREEYTTHIPTEDEIVQQFIGHLGEFFTNHGTLAAYIAKRYDEVFGKDVIDPKEVLELTTLQAEVDGAYMKLSEMMRVRAPSQLGPLWTRFNAMNDKVKAGQEARQLKQKREKAKRDAQLWNERNDRIDRSIAWSVGLGLVFYFWVLMGCVWLNTTTMG